MWENDSRFVTSYTSSTPYTANGDQCRGWGGGGYTASAAARKVAAGAASACATPRNLTWDPRKKDAVMVRKRSCGSVQKKDRVRRQQPAPPHPPTPPHPHPTLERQLAPRT